MEPIVKLFAVPYRNKTHYTVEIITPHGSMQIGVSPTGRKVTPYDFHKGSDLWDYHQERVNT